MPPCPDCGNPCAALWRTQCQWLHGGTPLCELRQIEMESRAAARLAAHVSLLLMTVAFVLLVYAKWNFYF